MRDPVYASELAHDTAGVDAGPFMQAALDSLVDDLLTTGKARGLRWQLLDFLAGDTGDLWEWIAGAVITRDATALHAEIERRLRAALEDDDAVHDLAAEMANTRDDE